jgi:hypothetical protein
VFGRGSFVRFKVGVFSFFLLLVFSFFVLTLLSFQLFFGISAPRAESLFPVEGGVFFFSFWFFLFFVLILLSFQLFFRISAPRAGSSVSGLRWGLLFFSPFGFFFFHSNNSPFLPALLWHFSSTGGVFVSG